MGNRRLVCGNLCHTKVFVVSPAVFIAPCRGRLRRKTQSLTCRTLKQLLNCCCATCGGRTARASTIAGHNTAIDMYTRAYVSNEIAWFLGPLVLPSLLRSHAAQCAPVPSLWARRASPNSGAQSSMLASASPACERSPNLSCLLHYNPLSVAHTALIPPAARHRGQPALARCLSPTHTLPPAACGNLCRTAGAETEGTAQGSPGYTPYNPTLRATASSLSRTQRTPSVLCYLSTQPPSKLLLDSHPRAARCSATCYLQYVRSKPASCNEVAELAHALRRGVCNNRGLQ